MIFNVIFIYMLLFLKYPKGVGSYPRYHNPYKPSSTYITFIIHVCRLQVFLTCLLSSTSWIWSKKVWLSLPALVLYIILVSLFLFILSKCPNQHNIIFCILVTTTLHSFWLHQTNPHPCFWTLLFQQNLSYFHISSYTIHQHRSTYQVASWAYLDRLLKAC